MFFYSFEGPEGAGKTTVIPLVEKRLKELGFKVFITREPGGTKKAETIRNAIMEHDYHPMTELLLFNAARVENFYENILPRTKRGEIVLCDRYVDSTFVYQFLAKSQGIKIPEELNKLIFNNENLPNRTYYLNVSLDTIKERLNGRGKENRFDEMEDAFHQNVITGYRSLAVCFKERIKWINGELTPMEVSAIIVEDILENMKKWGK